MRAYVKIIALILMLAAVLPFTVSCESGISSGDTYYLYSYDSKGGRFEKLGSSIKFGEGLKTFTYSYGDGDLQVTGTVTHVKTPSSYLLECNQEATALVTEYYRKSLIQSGKYSEEDMELFEAILANVTPKAQYFSYGANLFTGNAVEMYRIAEKNSDSFEGIYHISGSQSCVRLHAGYMYEADDSGNYTIRSGYYTISNDILTLTATDGNGNEKYVSGVLKRTKYLMAKVTVPRDNEGTFLGKSLEDQLETSDFVKEINGDIASYAGKTVAVLCENFFTEKI